MENEELFIDFIEVSLSEENEALFIEKYASDHEFRNDFKLYLKVINAINESIKPCEQSKESKERLFATLGFSTSDIEEDIDSAKVKSSFISDKVTSITSGFLFGILSVFLFCKCKFRCY